MPTFANKLWGLLSIALFALLLLLALLPQESIPRRLAPVVAAKGKFDGTPLRLDVPVTGKPDVPASFAIRMDHGICRATLNQGATSKILFLIGAGHARARLPAGSQLLLDPQGGAGRYDISLGPEWHPLAPKTRHSVFLPAALSMLLASLFAGTLQAQVNRLGTARFLYLIALGVPSGLILYPVLHEGGHLLFGILLGAAPNWPAVAWTSLGGEEPHAAFTHLPQNAGPFMSAGGPILPTLVALILLLLWTLTRRNASWYLSAALVFVPVLLLFSSLGCLLELYQNSHMDALSVHLGLAGPFRVAFSLSPLLLTIAVYVWLAKQLRRPKSTATTPQPSSGSSVSSE